MKLITWNCQGAFREKANFILNHNPDILVVQECEHPDKLIYSSTVQKPTDYLWFGDNLNKGLAVFSYGKFKLKLYENHNPDFKLIAPIFVTGGKFDFTLFAIWANNPQNKNNQYIEQVWYAINHYDNLLNSGNTILTGDFNSNKIWDKKHKDRNHSAVVERLKSKSIESLYHLHLKQEQGKEEHPTFHLQRKKEKPYHIDYCFVSSDICTKFESLEIGDYENWVEYSDHIPLIVNFKK